MIYFLSRVNWTDKLRLKSTGMKGRADFLVTMKLLWIFNDNKRARKRQQTLKEGSGLSVDWVISACYKAGAVLRAHRQGKRRETQGRGGQEEDTQVIRVVDGCSGPIHTEQLEGLASWWETNRIYEKMITQEIALLTQKEQLSHPVNAFSTPAAVIRGWELTSGNLENRAAQLCRANVDPLDR